MKTLSCMLDFLFGNSFYKKVDMNSEYMKEYNAHRPGGPDKRYCFAPYKNLYFGQLGEVATCCASSYVTIHGFYPEKSIREIWESISAKKMRACVSKGYLAPSCYLCYKQIEEKNFYAAYSHVYEWWNIEKKYPVMMEFYLGNNCNLECIMCSSVNSSGIAEKKNIRQAKSPYDDKFIEQLEEFIPHLKQVFFYGGEPFLIPIYYKIWERIIDLNPGCKIDITTNGTVFNEKVKSILDRAEVNLIISIDSLKKENFENIRKNADFETVMQNFQKFHEYCLKKKTNFHISFNPIQQNWKEIPDIISFANNHNVGVIFNRVWEPPQCALWNWDAEKLKEVYTYLLGFDFTNENEIQQYNYKTFADFREQILLWSQKLKEFSEKEKEFGKNNITDFVCRELNVFQKEFLKGFFKKKTSQKKLDKRIEIISDIIANFDMNDYEENKFRQFIYMQKDFFRSVFYFSETETIKRIISFAIGRELTTISTK